MPQVTQLQSFLKQEVEQNLAVSVFCDEFILDVRSKFCHTAYLTNEGSVYISGGTEHEYPTLVNVQHVSRIETAENVTFMLKSE